MCKFVSKFMKKLERIQNKLTPFNTNVFGGKLGKAIGAMGDEGPSDIEALSAQANKELAEEKSKATEDTIQQTLAKRFRSGARGRRSLLRSKSGGGAGFYNRFQL